MHRVRHGRLAALGWIHCVHTLLLLVLLLVLLLLLLAPSTPLNAVGEYGLMQQLSSFERARV